MKNINYIIFSFIIVCSLSLSANTINVTTNQNWSAISTGSGLNGLPSSSDRIVIKNGATLTADVVSASCKAIQLAASNTAGSLTIATNVDVTVDTIYMGDLTKIGTLNMTTAGSILNINAFAQTGNANTAKLNATNGTINFNANNTLPSSTLFVKCFNVNVVSGTTTLSKTTTISGALAVTANGIINVSDNNLTISGTTTVDGGLVDNATLSTITFKNLIMNEGSFTTTASNTKFNVTGNLTVNGITSVINGGAISWTITGSFNVSASTVNTIGGNSFSVAGTSNIDGTINWDSTITNRTFKAVNLNSGGIWKSITPGAHTFTCSGLFTFNGGIIDGIITNTYKLNGGLKVTAGATASIAKANVTVQTVATTIDGTILFNDVAGTKSFVSNVTVSAGGVWSNPSNTDIKFSGNLSNDGTFNAGNGIYTFAGTKTIGSSTTGFSFVDMVVSSGTRTNNTTITCTNSLTGAGTFKQGAGAVLNIQNSISLTGFNATTATNTVNYNTAADVVLQKGTYYHLNLNTNVNYTLNAAASVFGDLKINAGILNLNAKITGNTTGVFLLASAAQLNVGSDLIATAIVFPTTFTTANINLQTGSIVRYKANIAQIIASLPNYSNLEISTGTTSVTKTIGLSNLNVSGNLTLNTGVTLNGATKTITVINDFLGSGNLTFGTNTGTLNLEGAWGFTGTFTCGKSTVSFNGSSQQIIPALNFYNLTSTLDGGRILANTGSINIANIFTPGTNIYTITNSTVNFNGTAAQTTPTFTFNNLTITNAFGLSLAGDVGIIGTLQIALGKITTTGFNLTLLSNSNQTGRIAALPGGTSIVGNIVQQRYTPLSFAGWGYLGSPVTNATLADWYNNNTEIPMSGFTGVSVASNSTTNFVSVFGYDETASGTSTSASSYVAPTNVTNTIVNGKGYYVYLGSSLNFSNPFTFDVTGLPKTGNVSFPITYTNFGSSVDDGWNLVANPYPSDIDWTSNSWTKTNVDNTIYIFDANINNYATFTSGATPDSTNGGSRYIASSQGFYVKANASGCILSCTENVKSNQQPKFFKNINAKENEIRIKITKEGTPLADEAVVRFSEFASDLFEPNLDIVKLYPSFGESVNIATIADNKKLTTNVLKNFSETFQLPLTIDVAKQGNYRVHLTGIEQLKAKYPDVFVENELVIENVITGATTSLTNTNDYIFSGDEKSQKLVLRFKANEKTTKIEKVEMFNTINIKAFDNSFYADFDMNDNTTANIQIFNLAGQLAKPIYSSNVTKCIVPIDTKNLENGVYIITITAGNKFMSKKIFVRN